jgi:hypothetical protein
MTSDSAGRRPGFLAAVLKPLVGLSLILLLPALSACTTAEGTNALVDPSTFEREVMDSTLQGLDIIPQDTKKPDTERRAPLVMPKAVAELPAPSKPNAAALPTDSDNPQINTAGLTDADIQHLRDARVVDLRSVAGRPLTDTERKEITARMAAANIQTSSSDNRPLTLPPVSYFSEYKGKDTVCKALDGTLVSLSDPRCPAQIRDAMRKSGPVVQSVDEQMQQENYDMENGINPNDPNEVQQPGH